MCVHRRVVAPVDGNRVVQDGATVVAREVEVGVLGDVDCGNE